MVNLIAEVLTVLWLIAWLHIFVKLARDPFTHGN